MQATDILVISMLIQSFKNFLGGKLQSYSFELTPQMRDRTTEIVNIIKHDTHHGESIAYHNGMNFTKAHLIRLFEEQEADIEAQSLYSTGIGLLQRGVGFSNRLIKYSSLGHKLFTGSINVKDFYTVFNGVWSISNTLSWYEENKDTIDVLYFSIKNIQTLSSRLANNTILSNVTATWGASDSLILHNFTTVNTETDKVVLNIDNLGIRIRQ